MSNPGLRKRHRLPFWRGRGGTALSKPRFLIWRTEITDTDSHTGECKPKTYPPWENMIKRSNKQQTYSC